jgi:hypothetical protein
MKITDLGAHYSPQFERVEMSNLDKVFERNRITKQGIDAMITNYLRLERELAEVKEQLRLCNVDQFTTAAELAEAVEKERERCALVCERSVTAPAGTYQILMAAAKAIRKGE